MKIVAIIPARLGGAGLPGKALRDLAGAPLLLRVVKRVQRAATIDEVLVATTDLERDLPLLDLCDRADVPAWCGSEDDVLDRYHEAAAVCGADTVVRVRSDCPFVDPDVIDQVVSAFVARRPGVDYASNTAPLRSWPRGLDTEVFTTAALNRAWRQDTDRATRAQVTPYISRHEGLFTLHNVVQDEDHSAHRWTVDTPEDFSFAAAVYDHFGHDRFGWREVLSVVQAHPELTAPGARVDQKVSL